MWEAFSKNSIQLEVNTYSVRARHCGRFFKGTGDEQDVVSTLKRSEDSHKRRENRCIDNLFSHKMSLTVIDM